MVLSILQRGVGRMTFEIFTDSSASLSMEQLKAYGINVLSLTFTEKGKEGEYKSFDNGRPVDTTVFYRRMRDEGAVFITSCVNTGDALTAIEPTLKAGKDVLYLGFSSGLSATYQNVKAALDELRAKYPERKILDCDTLAAALGQGLLVVLAARKRDAGMSIEETCRWVEENKLRLCHWFTVESLKYLRRGGRVSAASAVVGTILDIKPVLHVDDAGKLIPISKVRGVKAAIKEMFERMKATSVRDPESPVFINHADAPQRAQELAEMIRREFGTKEIVVDNLDLVIGAHSGPGTIALFFVGDHR